MKEKGFTLAELLGVITVLAILCLIAFPSIISQIRKQEGSFDSATKELLTGAIDAYLGSHTEEYKMVEGQTYCITIQDLVSSGVIEEPLTNAKGEEISLSTILQVKVLARKDFEVTYDAKNCTAS